MATINPQTGELTLQIVYDGAPFSGKTRSLRTLGQILGRETTSPEERGGRTLYFDWLDCRRGTCGGQPIQFRVVAVPGQVHLARRRAALLDMADAVIFVADSTRSRFQKTVEHFAGLRGLLSENKREIPLLLQLNKRDEPDIMSPDEMLEGLGAEWFRRSVKTIATDGVGIREAFVFASGEVIRDLRISGALYQRTGDGLNTGQFHPSSPEQLLASLSDPKPEDLHRDTVEFPTHLLSSLK